MSEGCILLRDVMEVSMNQTTLGEAVGTKDLNTFLTKELTMLFNKKMGVPKTAAIPSTTTTTTLIDEVLETRTMSEGVPEIPANNATKNMLNKPLDAHTEQYLGVRKQHKRFARFNRKNLRNIKQCCREGCQSLARTKGLCYFHVQPKCCMESCKSRAVGKGKTCVSHSTVEALSKTWPSILIRKSY